MRSYPKQDCYATLGLDPSVSDETIEIAYSGLKRAYHPDKYASKPDADQAAAKKKLDDINEGFDRLREGIGVRQVVTFECA